MRETWKANVELVYIFTASEQNSDVQRRTIRNILIRNFLSFLAISFIWNETK